MHSWPLLVLEITLFTVFPSINKAMTKKMRIFNTFQLIVKCWNINEKCNNYKGTRPSLSYIYMETLAVNFCTIFHTNLRSYNVWSNDFPILIKLRVRTTIRANVWHLQTTTCAIFLSCRETCIAIKRQLREPYFIFKTYHFSHPLLISHRW